MTDDDGDAAGAAGAAPGGARPSDETRRLLAAVQEWTQRTFPAPPSGHGGPECQWCPLCQLAAALRGEYPDLTERVAEAGTAVANALRALAESGPPRPGGRPRPEASAGDPMPPVPPAPPTAERYAPRPRVQRIRLDGDEPDIGGDAGRPPGDGG
jgi:hypothetical protein